MDDCDAAHGQPGTIGFLSILNVRELGFCGGYLLLNSAGRPLEFHCTLPVKPDRAQQILYGVSLETFLFCEHIGKPLLGKTRLGPAAVFVQQAKLLGVQEQIAPPVAHLWRQPRETSPTSEPASPPHAQSSEEEVPQADTAAALEFQTVAESGRVAVRQLVTALSPQLDLLEPFDRIRDAIQEAHSTRAA